MLGGVGEPIHAGKASAPRGLRAVRSSELVRVLGGGRWAAVAGVALEAIFYGFAQGVDGRWRPWPGVGRVAAGAVVVSRSRATSHKKEHRLSRPTPGRDASGGPPGAPARRASSLRGVGRTLITSRRCLWFRSGSLIASSLRLGVPRRSAGVKSMPLRPGGVGGGRVWHGLDTVGPSWAAVCADATRDPDLPPCGVSGTGRVTRRRHRPPLRPARGQRYRRSQRHRRRPMSVRRRAAGARHRRGGRFGSLVASAGEANLAGLVVSSRTRRHHSGGDSA